MGHQPLQVRHIWRQPALYRVSGFALFSFDLALTDRKMEVKVGLKVALESWDVEIFDTTPYLLCAKFNLHIYVRPKLKQSKQVQRPCVYIWPSEMFVLDIRINRYWPKTYYTAFDLPIIDFLTIWARNILFVP